MVILHKLASLYFLPSLRTVKHKNHKHHETICRIGAFGTGKTTIMHRWRAVQAAERVLEGGIPWLNFVMACLDLKLQISLHCCVIFRYQHRAMFQE